MKKMCVIPKDQILSGIDMEKWIIGCFIGFDGGTERYEAALYDGKIPTDYPAMLQIVPYENEPIGFQFYLNFAKPDKLDVWKRKTHARHLGIPVLLGEGIYKINDQKYKFIVIERHGKDLSSLFFENGKRFKAHTAFKITYQMLTILRYIHSKSYFQNYISGLDIVVDVATQNHIYLINKYVAPENNIALQSRDSHNGVQTRRGDLEALFYNLVQWLGIELPWEKNLEDPSLVLKEKEKAFADVDKFLQKTKIPSPVSEFVRLIDEMNPISKPRYSNFTRILTKGLRSLYHVPYGKLDFRITNVPIVELTMGNFNQVNEPQKRRKQMTTTSLNEISVAKLANIISENCRHEDEVRLRETGPDSLIEIIYQVTCRKRCSKWQNKLADAWKRDTAGLKMMTRSLWREKGLQANVITNEAASTDNEHEEGDEIPPQENSLSLDPRIISPPNVRQTLEDPRLSSSFRRNRVQSPVSHPSSSGCSSQRSIPGDSHSEEHGRLSEVIVLEVKQEDNGTDEEVIECERSESVGYSSWQDKYNMLNTWLDMKKKELRAFDSIPSEPQMVANQVQKVRVLVDDFRRGLRLRQLIELTDVLSKLLPSSADAKKIKQVESVWQEQLDRLVKRGRALGDTSLDQLSKALHDVSSKLEKLLLDKESEEQLLTKLETLVEHLESVQRAQLANAVTLVAQLRQAISDSTEDSELRYRLLFLKNFNKQLQNKIDDKTGSIQNSIVERREFDKLCKETDDWLVKGLANVLLVPTDRKKMQQQHDDYKVEHQLNMDRETEVMELLKRGRDTARLRNATQKQFLELIESRWNQLTKQSLDIVNKLKACAEICDQFYEKQERFLCWLNEAERKLESFKPASLDDISNQLKELSALQKEVLEKSGEFEQTMSLGETFVSACDEDNDDTVKNDLSAAKDRWTKLNHDLLNRLQSFEDMDQHFAEFNASLLDLQQKIEPYENESALHDALEATAKDSKLLRVRKLEMQMTTLRKPLDAVRQQADGLVLKAREQGINVSHLRGVVKLAVSLAVARIENCETKLRDIHNGILELEYARFLEEIQTIKPVESRDSCSKAHSERRQDHVSETNSPRRDEKKSESPPRKRRSQSKNSISSFSKSSKNSDGSESHKNNKYDDARPNYDITQSKPTRLKNSKDDLDRNSRISRNEDSRQETSHFRSRRTYYDSDRNPPRSSNYRRYWRAYRSNRPRCDSRSGWRSRSPERNQTWDVQQKQPFKNIARKNSFYGQATRARYRTRGWKPNVASKRERSNEEDDMNEIHVKSNEW